jgi:hypothetical protein
MPIVADRVVEVPASGPPAWEATCGTCHRSIRTLDQQAAWRWLGIGPRGQTLSDHHDYLILPVMAGVDPGEPTSDGRVSVTVAQRAAVGLLDIPEVFGAEVHRLTGALSIGALLIDHPTDVDGLVTHIRQALLQALDGDVAVLPVGPEVHEQTGREGGDLSWLAWRH